MIYYLFTCNHNYKFSHEELQRKSFKYHNYVIDGMVYAMLGLEIYWLKVTIVTMYHVYQLYKKESV